MFLPFAHFIFLSLLCPSHPLYTSFFLYFLLFPSKPFPFSCFPFNSCHLFSFPSIYYFLGFPFLLFPSIRSPSFLLSLFFSPPSSFLFLFFLPPLSSSVLVLFFFSSCLFPFHPLPPLPLSADIDFLLFFSFLKPFIPPLSSIFSSSFSSVSPYFLLLLFLSPYLLLPLSS